ncbi:hypothetical protein ABPG73_009787 [Tetrahymena malaccensis]
MNSSKDFERNQEQIINQLQSTIEILLTEYNPTQNVQEYDKTNSTKNESDCNQSDSSQFICSPFCTDFVTVHKRNKKIKKELFIVEYKKKLTQSQEELIAELRQKNLKFTKDYLDIIVVAMEEKHYYLKSFLTSGGQSDIFQGSCQKEENFDSPFLQELVQIIESRMIIQSSNDRIDCLDLIQSIYEIVLHQDLKSISAFYLEKINKIISSNKYDNKKDIPFVLKAKKIYSQLHLQIRLHLSNIILFKDQIDAVQIDFLLLSSKIPLQQMKNIPDSACLNNVGKRYDEIGENTIALNYLTQALTMSKLLYNHDHPMIATSLHNLGQLYAKIGQPQKGLQFQIEALKVKEGIYPPNHPKLSQTLHNIGQRYAELVNKYQKQLAESNFQKDKQQIPFSKSSSSDQKQQVDKQQNDQPQSLQELQKSW